MKALRLTIVFVPVLTALRFHSVTLPISNYARRGAVPRMSLPTYVPQEDIQAISEQTAVASFANLQTTSLQVANAVANGPVDVAYLKTNVKASDKPPLLLVHGFDISCLEFRRLLPLLEEAGIEAYAPCIPGWGFTDTRNLKTIGIDAKRATLLAFHRNVLEGRPAVWVGASLGACIALDCFKEKPSAFVSMVNLAPAFFTDAPPIVPEFVARLLLRNVLSASNVRESIAKQAYFAKELQTEDAIRCGNLHLNRPQWEDDSLEWLLSGAYAGIDQDVQRFSSIPILTLWGRQDEVIPPGAAVPQVMAALPDAQFRWVEESGHTPHLEQPAFTARAIAAFLRGDTIAGDMDASEVILAYKRIEGIKAKVLELGIAAKQKAVSLGKLAAVRIQEAVDKQTK